ncbi:MAG: hypothetical protein VX000_12045, partial [Myxococcota bacterium]|nr:hypothetical protein [Myxococcota bacterium]
MSRGTVLRTLQLLLASARPESDLSMHIPPAPDRRRAALLGLLLVGATGCTDPVLRTGIKIQLTADNPSAVRNNVDRIYIVIDSEQPFTDDGEPYEDGAEISSTVTMQNWDETDDALELVYELTSLGSSGPLPVLELRQGANPGPFTVQASGWLADTETLGSEVEGPISFINKTVPTYNLAVGLLDVPVTPCLNGADDDADGWTDAADPDCSRGDQEIGVDEALPCNDGADNDGDGFIDGNDPECSDAQTPSEAAPCSDGEDNDEDGYTDSDDPDCLTGSTEAGFGQTECNDGED